MNVLMVVHQFLPRHLAGSEVYTFRLARALQDRGHRLLLFYTEIHPSLPQYDQSSGNYDGLSYVEVVHNRDFRSFEQTYRDLRMEVAFQRVLDTFRPDVIHLQHLHLHSLGYPAIAKARRIPIVYTLHEYMLICLNEGLLLRPGAVPCPGAEAGACARCAAAVYPHLPLKPGVLNGLERLAGKLGLPRRPVPSSLAAGDLARVQAVRARRAAVEQALAHVDLFIAPSRFLRERFLAEGLVEADRIVYSDYGFRVPALERPPRTPSQLLRIGYVGTISEYKGVHLVIDAVRGLPQDRLDCRIYGNPEVFPDYSERLSSGGLPACVQMAGAVPNDGVPDVMTAMDALVVPSLWAENSPLTIHEAFMAGTPVITSDYGGMAELVEDGRNGLHFRRGDAIDLRRQLRRLLNEPGLLASLRNGMPAVKRIEDDAADMERHYVHLRNGTAVPA
jgi:glycosyltransferase involved in cell wall biosynthesis